MKSVLLLTALAFATFAHASVITQNTGETSGSLTEYFGESFTTPSGGPWNNLSFNFFSDIPAMTPSAAGTAYLLSQAFTGSPTTLSSAAPGFIAASTGISGGKYIFAPGIQLAANTMYFLFENGVITATGGDSVPGGLAYFAPHSTDDFSLASGDSSNS